MSNYNIDLKAFLFGVRRDASKITDNIKRFAAFILKNHSNPNEHPWTFADYGHDARCQVLASDLCDWIIAHEVK